MDDFQAIIGKKFTNGSQELTVQKQSGPDSNVFLANITSPATGENMTIPMLKTGVNALASTFCENSMSNSGFCSRMSVMDNGKILSIPGFAQFKESVQGLIGGGVETSPKPTEVPVTSSPSPRPLSIRERMEQQRMASTNGSPMPPQNMPITSLQSPSPVVSAPMIGQESSVQVPKPQPPPQVPPPVQTREMVAENQATAELMGFGYQPAYKYMNGEESQDAIVGFNLMM